MLLLIEYSGIMKYTHTFVFALLACIFMSVLGTSAFANEYYEIFEDPESVSICNQEYPYSWRGRNYKKDNTYRDTVIVRDKRQAEEGEELIRVDTMHIYTLKLKSYTHTVETRTVHLCDECSFVYNGKAYTKPGVYDDTIPVPGTCDSIFRLNILRADGWHLFDTAHSCIGKTYKWRSQRLTEYGDYTDEYKTVSGYDSIYHLHLIVHDPVDAYDTVIICQEDAPYYWMKNRYNNSGDYEVSLRTRYGCDSICHLNLTILPHPKPDTVIQYFCPNQGFVTHGMKVTEDATFRDTIAAVNGCDSVIVSHYIPYPTYLIEEVKQHFENEPFEWQGKTFTTDTVYQEVYQNRFGCDSIWQLRLITKYDVYEHVNLCADKGEVIQHGGVDVTDNMTFHDTLLTVRGADSIVHTTYTLSHSFYHRDSIFICENQEVPWVGHLNPDAPMDGVDGEGNPIATHPYYMLSAVAGTPGIFFDSYHLANGCDSTYEIVVTARNAHIKDTLVIWCKDSLDKYGPFRWKDIYGDDQEWSMVTDTFLYTLKATTQEDLSLYDPTTNTWQSMSGGCDSIERIHLIVTTHCSLETIYMCPGGSVDVDGYHYTQPGRYANWMPTEGSNVRDSLHTFDIVLADTKEVDIYQVVRQPDLPYIWYGQVLQKTGVYDQMLETQHGCDSLVHLHLTVAPTKYADGGIVDFCVGKDQRITLPTYHVITPKSKTENYLDTVQYMFTFVDAEGHTQHIMADSVITYHLVGHESFFENKNDFIHKGGTYKWHKDGQPITIEGPGEYWDSCHTVYGCDSVYRLYLVEVDNWYHKDTAYVCQNELPHVWHGRDLYKDSTYFDSLPTHHGMDSVYEHRLIIYKAYVKDTFVFICHDTEYRHNGKVIPIQEGTSSYVFDDTLKTRYTGCDSIYRYHLYRTPKTITSDGIAYIEKGKSYTWPRTGKEYSALGFHYDTVRSPLTNCDSIVYTLEIREDQPFYDTLRVSVCQSELPYWWRNRPFRKDTVLEDRFETHFLDLDSIYRLELTVRPTYRTEETKYICKGEGVNFKGDYITTPGIYYDSIKSTNLCDSIHVLNLVRAPSYFFPETMTYVTDDDLPLVWAGHYDERGNVRTLPTEGIYYDSLTTQVGHPCDSVHQVTVIHTKMYNFEEYAAICAGSYHTWQGDRLDATGVYTKRYKSIHNLDSIYTLHLTVNPIDTTRLEDVYMCPDEPYVFFGEEITEAGTYYKTLVNTRTNCDSIIVVVVNEYDNSPIVQTHVQCGGYVEIGGEKITSSGVYYEMDPAPSLCARPIKHIVTIGKPYYQEEARVIRKGAKYTWHHCGEPVILDKAGEYWDSCHTMYGCDSVMKLTLEYVKDYVYPRVYDTICYADLPYIWNTYPISKAISEEGLHYDTCRSNAADTIRSLHLKIIPTKRTSVIVPNCFGETYRVNGILYTEDAVANDTFPGKHGCDSIVTYHLKFYPKYEKTQTVKLTPAQPYIYIKGADNIIGGDTTLRTTGIYYFKYTSIHGCDSLVTLIVDECKETKLNVIPYDMCKGDALIINGKRITQPGPYDFHFTSIDGCDSIVRYVVRVNPAYEFTQTETMCKNSSYRWLGHHHDTVYTRQGTYYDSLQTTLGCDSVYVLKLTYKRTDLFDTIVSICESDLPYQYKGKLYNEDNIFYDTLANNVEGCDSVLRWTFVVNKHCSEYVQYRRCEGQYKIVDGMVIEKAGTYIHHHLTADGQDSLYRFTVHDLPNYESFVSLSGCDSIEFDGKTYYARGPGQENFNLDLRYESIDGCDSIIHLDLTIYMSSPTHTYSRTIADFDSVRFGPFYHNTQGSHTMHYTNIHGCDSTEILNLTVMETEYQDLVHYQICAGDRRGIEVFGQIYMPDQEYRYIADTTWIAGKPIIRTADIIVRQPFAISRFDAQEEQLICSDFETSFNVQFATVDPLHVPDYYAVDFLTGEFEAHPMHQEGEVNGKNSLDIQMTGQGKYITPGYYRYRLKFWSAACEFNDTTLQGSILVRYPANVMESAWNDAVMLLNEQYNGGGWVFRPPYTWNVMSEQGIDKTALVAGDATQPYLYSSSLEEGDRITAMLYREGYDEPIPTCEFIFKPLLSVTNYPILIYPAAVRQSMPVTVKANRNGQFRLFNEMGQVCSNGTFGEGETLVTLPSRSGCYVMMTEDTDGNRKVQKIIVY